MEAPEARPATAPAEDATGEENHILDGASRSRSTASARRSDVTERGELPAVTATLPADGATRDTAELFDAADGRPADGDDGPVRAESVCPFLVAAGGSWRLARPSREHRCSAVDPMATPSASKQRHLCLVDGHLECATFEAARSLRGTVVGGGAARPAWPVGARPIVQTVPLVVDAGRPAVVGSLRARPRLGQAALVGILVVALAAFGYGRVFAPAAAPGPSPSPTPAPSASPSSSASQAPSTSPAASPSPTKSVPSATPRATATPAPSATPRPSGTTTYTVRPGDTLSGIAARFGTTVAVLEQLNHITNPSVIHPGDVLIVP